MRQLLFFLIPFLVCACGSEESLKKQQFISQGKLVYQKQCVQCHQEDGNGYEMLYPPLNKADILVKDPMSNLCYIVNGLDGELIVNGASYNMPMPKFNHLTNDELAKLLTYISNAWDNKGELSEAEDIAKSRSANCAN